jgi:transcriptional regulator GlxA family with amidase domain
MANTLAQWTGMPTPGFEVTLVGVRPQVRTALGLQVPVREITDTPVPNWVIVPALASIVPEQLVPTLAHEDVINACGALRSWHSAGARLSAACTGTFVLAESGLLVGREATTTWWLTPVFRQRYPDVRLDAHRIVVPSGAVGDGRCRLSHLDLALWLIRSSSPELAGLVAKYLVFDTRLSQSAYAIQIISPIPTRWSSASTAGCVSASIRYSRLIQSPKPWGPASARRLDAVLGKTPIEYIQDLRIERAVHLLKTSNHSVDRIAGQVGYADGVTLRTLLRRRLGKGIRELRLRE